MCLTNQKTDGGVRLRRIRYIKETLCNPEEIRESVSESRKNKSITEVYINTCFTDANVPEGEVCKVVVEPILDFSTFQRAYKFKTFYLPNEETLIKNNHSFLVFHEKHNRQAVIGIEALDFTETASAMDCDSIVLPEFEFTFNIIESNVRGIMFKDLLKWAYGEFIAKARFVKAA